MENSVYFFMLESRLGRLPKETVRETNTKIGGEA